MEKTLDVNHDNIKCYILSFKICITFKKKRFTI